MMAQQNLNAKYRLSMAVIFLLLSTSRSSWGVQKNSFVHLFKSPWQLFHSVFRSQGHFYRNDEALELSDELLNAQVNKLIEYRPVLEEFRWIVPSENLPREVHFMPSNNNLAIAFYKGRLFLAWRSAPTHFAGVKTKLFIVSSLNWGESWQLEQQIAMGTDVREPFLLNFSGKLYFYFFEAGRNPIKFQPQKMWHMIRNERGAWSTPVPWGLPGEIPWEFKIRNGQAWMTSYRGNHYSTSDQEGISVYFKTSNDGLNWVDVNGERRVVYQGGVSEVGFEFDDVGDLWGVTRNEDGDETGFGSHVITAAKHNLSSWEFPAQSNPWRYDSPRMFRHGKDLYLIARRDVGGPFDRGLKFLPMSIRRIIFWVAYSFRSKRTTLYKIDRERRRVVPIFDLPSAGDTAFPSILRLGVDTYLIANYTSPLQHPGRNWIWGQLSPQGTQIYFLTLKFKCSQ